MDFGSNGVSMGNGLVWSNGVLQQQEQEQSNNSSDNCGVASSSSIPYATPINGFEGQNGNYGWVTAPTGYYAQQSAKHNVALFQTPIFGIE